MTDAERHDARLLQVFVTGIKHWSHVGSKETALRLHAAGYLHRSQAGRFYLIGRGERLLIAARRLRPPPHPKLLRGRSPTPHRPNIFTRSKNPPPTLSRRSPMSDACERCGAPVMLLRPPRSGVPAKRFCSARCQRAAQKRRWKRKCAAERAEVAK